MALIGQRWFSSLWTRTRCSYSKRNSRNRQEAQRQLDGLEKKTKQLINIAIQTANRNPRGVMFHAMMAKTAGASRKEVLGAVAMNLHLSGLAAVLESLPAAVEGYDKK
jgi:AhpD family alkylhydroperoxidase